VVRASSLKSQPWRGWGSGNGWQRTIGRPRRHRLFVPSKYVGAILSAYVNSVLILKAAGRHDNGGIGGVGPIGLNRIAGVHSSAKALDPAKLTKNTATVRNRITPAAKRKARPKPRREGTNYDIVTLCRPVLAVKGGCRSDPHGREDQGRDCNAEGGSHTSTISRLAPRTRGVASAPNS
jgi:hypothetical protein